MSNLHSVNRAIFNVLKQFPGVHYVCVFWNEGDAGVTSDQDDDALVFAKLIAAATIVIRSADIEIDDIEIDDDEVAGHA